MHAKVYPVLLLVWGFKTLALLGVLNLVLKHWVKFSLFTTQITKHSPFCILKIPFYLGTAFEACMLWLHDIILISEDDIVSNMIKKI